MSQAVVTALIGAASMVLGALFAFLIQARRLPSDMRLTEAQAEKAQHEAAALVISDLKDEVARLKEKVGEFEGRMTKAEARTTETEERLADSEASANRFRLAVIALGSRLDQERAKNREMVVKLVGIIKHLLDCVEHPEQVENIDRPAIAHLMQAILDGYLPEQIVGVF
jgi:chromosome segregation ATPase